jgi:hypothetical protein
VKDALRSRRLLACWLVVLVAAVLGLWQLAHDVRKLHSDIANGSTLTRVGRALVPAETAQIAEREIFPRAAAAMPPSARFFVMTGPGVPGQLPGGLRWVRPFAAYWLLPRRLVGDASQADWVLSYGGDLASLGVRFSRRVQLAPGVELAEVSR